MPTVRRVSHSLLDPFYAPLVKPLYTLLHIPRWFPPEGIVIGGHLAAIVGAVGLTFAPRGGVWAFVAAAGVLISHFADMVDGTHARATGQCRNGGELLDHFVDPLSFSYWATGLALSCGQLLWGIAAVIVVNATSVLVNIKAKITGEFSLSAFGPTETKTLLVLYGLVQAFAGSRELAFWFLAVLTVAGALTLKLSLLAAIRQVNATAAPAADDKPWELRSPTGPPMKRE